MVARTKSDLIETTQKEYAKLVAILDTLESAAAIKRRGQDTSIKDVVAHRAHWIDLFFGWYEDGRAGKIVYFPAEGYKWNDLKRYNADLREHHASLTWSDAKALLVQNYHKLVDFLECRSDAELYGAPMKGAQNAWTPGRWAEAAGPRHFCSASKFIRSAIKTDAC